MLAGRGSPAPNDKVEEGVKTEDEYFIRTVLQQPVSQ